MHLTGTVHYHDIGPGFWGITDNKGNQYRPINFPEQLKFEGRKISIQVKEVDEGASIFQWGIPVKIISFHT